MPHSSDADPSAPGTVPDQAWQGILDDGEVILWQARPQRGYLSGILRHKALWLWAAALFVIAAVLLVMPPFSTSPVMMSEEQMLRRGAIAAMAVIWGLYAFRIGQWHNSRFYTLTNSHAYIASRQTISVRNLLWDMTPASEQLLTYFSFRPETRFQIINAHGKRGSVQHLYAAQISDEAGQIYDDATCLFQDVRLDPALPKAIAQIAAQNTPASSSALH